MDRRIAAGGKPGVDPDVQAAHEVLGLDGGDLGGDPIGDLGLDLLENRDEQPELALELVVEGTPGHAGRAGDLVGADRGEPPVGEQRARGSDERAARFGGALGLRALAFHTTCP